MAGLMSVTDDVRAHRPCRARHDRLHQCNDPGTRRAGGSVTTSGFGDPLEIGRTRRMLPSLYDPSFVRPPPLVPRPLRIEVAERLDGGWCCVDALDEDAVLRRPSASAGQPGLSRYAFCTVGAIDRHERRASDILRRLMPGVFVTTSAEVIPEFREYERFSTAVINAFLMPVMDHYLGALDDSLSQAGCAGRLITMSSAGGVLDTAHGTPAAGAHHSLRSGGRGRGRAMGRGVGGPRAISSPATWAAPALMFA